TRRGRGRRRGGTLNAVERVVSIPHEQPSDLGTAPVRASLADRQVLAAKLANRLNDVLRRQDVWHVIKGLQSAGRFYSHLLVKDENVIPVVPDLSELNGAVKRASEWWPR